MNPSRAVGIACLIALMAIGAAPWRSLPECALGKWSGITPTDAAGNTVGPIDPTDWGCLAVTGGTSALDVPTPGPPPNFCMFPASPNPATAETRLRLAVPRTGRVSVAVYAKQGNGPHNARLVRTLLDSTLPAGIHEILWDGKGDDGLRLSADLYRVVMETELGAVCGDVELR